MAGLYVQPGYVDDGYVQGASIYAELHKLNGKAWVDLFELDLTPLGGTLVRFHAGTSELRQPVIWQGNTYEPFPIQAEGFEWNGGGQLPRPKLRVANVSGLISALVRDYDDLIGMRLTRKRTMVQYLDEENFAPRRNLLIHTDSLAAAGWTRGTGIASITDNQPSPDGNATAVRLASLNTTTTVNTGAVVYRSFTVAPGSTYTVSVHCKANTPGTFSIRYGIAADAQVASFPLRADGQTHRLSAAFLAGAAGGTSATCLFGAQSPGIDVTLWGAQAELGALTPYQPIGSSFVRNPTADPYSFLPDEIYFVTQKTAENRLMVEFELGSSLDLQGVSLPRRQIIAGVCPWRYRDNTVGACSYSGGPVADRFDVPTTDPAVDNCSHTLKGCKLRFGVTAVLPFGGFPSSGLTRR